MNDDDQAYWVLGPGQIQLSVTAREWAQEFGMTETEMAKHLLAEHQKREAGLIQREGEG
jgi:hypothetical protein